jgi:DNA-binding NtrC family response regulator
MNILIVEDEQLMRESLRRRLTHEGFSIGEAPDVRTATAALDRGAPDLVLLDLKLPDGDGMSILDVVHERRPALPVIVLTGCGEVSSAVAAMKRGATDYMAKPFDPDELTLSIRRALEHAPRERRPAPRSGLHCLVGRSMAMHEIAELVRKVARSQASTVLLRGESGTGKDLIAKAIHFESTRASEPFMNITCTALQDTLLESELFGHEKGAFTDAKARKEGLFELAHGGTVFLDEIGDMSPHLQAKLLRVLEEKSFRRIGGIQDLHVDVRVIASTHAPLEKAISEQRFREDLYYRLNVITIDIPPLRERREDIPVLAEHFLRHFSGEFRNGGRTLAPEALRKLEGHDWPGNVRELKNVIERAVLLGAGPVVQEQDIALERHRSGVGPAVDPLSLPAGGVRFGDLEREMVRQALVRAAGNQTKAGELLGMSRDQIRYRIQKFGFAK